MYLRSQKITTWSQLPLVRLHFSRRSWYLLGFPLRELMNAYQSVDKCLRALSRHFRWKNKLKGGQVRHHLQIKNTPHGL